MHLGDQTLFGGGGRAKTRSSGRLGVAILLGMHILLWVIDAVVLNMTRRESIASYWISMEKMTQRARAN